MPFYLDVRNGEFAELVGWSVSWVNPHDQGRRRKSVFFLTKARADKAKEVKVALRMENVTITPATHPYLRQQGKDLSWRGKNDGRNTEKLHGDLG